MDDVVIAIATLVTFAHTAADYVALKGGLASPWDRIVKSGNVQLLNDVCASPRVGRTIC